MSKMMRTSTSSVRSDPIKKGFEVRVPERRRFQHVGSKLDTGATARSVRYLTNSQVLRRRDETFRRISRDDRLQLFEEYEKVDDERLDTLGLGLDGGCGPVIASYAADDNEEYERPYLVLDVRDPAAFARMPRAAGAQHAAAAADAGPRAARPVPVPQPGGPAHRPVRRRRAHGGGRGAPAPCTAASTTSTC